MFNWIISLFKRKQKLNQTTVFDSGIYDGLKLSAKETLVLLNKIETQLKDINT